MKVGVLTLHRQTNYGGVLQAFAGKYFLESLGHEVRFVKMEAETRQRSFLTRLKACVLIAILNIVAIYYLAATRDMRSQLLNNWVAD